MRELRIVFIYSLFGIDYKQSKYEVYVFNKNTSDENDLKNIVIDINKSQEKIVYLFTNKEDLFESFNRELSIFNYQFKE